MTLVKNERKQARVAVFWPVDWIILSYCLIMALAVVVLGRPLNPYTGELIFYCSTAVLIALIVNFIDENQSRAWSFVRLLYPALLFTFLYRATGGHMFLVTDHFLDDHVIAWETALFGQEPTLYLDRHFANVWINEIMSFCYFAYYLMLPGFLVWAFVRRESRIIRSYLAAACITFFVSYLLFWLYPVEGPRWHLAAEYVNGIDGPLFTRVVKFVIERAAVHGGAMPSSHTGVAVVTLLFCFRYWRKAARWLLPVVVGLALGTVWGRYHYVSDVVVGAAIGGGAVWLVRKYLEPDPAIVTTAKAPQFVRSFDAS